MVYSPDKDSLVVEKVGESNNINCISEQSYGSYMAMSYEEHSNRAIRLLDELTTVLAQISGLKKKPGILFRRAITCMVANLLRIENHDKYLYGFHGMNPAAFRLLPVDYRNFRSVASGFEQLGYIVRNVGYKEHTGRGAKAMATTFRATPLLLGKVAAYGIVPAEWETHFRRLPRPKAIPNPVVLKSQSTFHGKGQRMRIDRCDPKVIELSRPIDELNAFFHRQVIDPDRHWGF